MSMVFANEPEEYRPTHIIRDRDGKFTEQFCSILKSEGLEFRPITPLAPNLNPHAEAWVQRVKRECLDYFIVFAERHLRYLLGQWLTYYHQFRPHQGLGNVPIATSLPPPQPPGEFRLQDVTSRQWLGGLLKHYERKAA